MSWPQVILSALNIIGKLISTSKPEPKHDAAAARHGAAAGAAAHQASRAAGPPRAELPTLNESEFGEYRRALLPQYHVLSVSPWGHRTLVTVVVDDESSAGIGASKEAALRAALFRLGLSPETARMVE